MSKQAQNSMSAATDKGVLAVMDAMLPENYDCALQEPTLADCNALREARATVAELIEAAEHASNVLAETYAKYQTKIGPFASQSQVANGKLRAALARCGGAQ